MTSPTDVDRWGILVVCQATSGVVDVIGQGKDLRKGSDHICDVGVVPGPIFMPPCRLRLRHGREIIGVIDGIALVM
jgi:hypothetical protein